MSALFDPTTLWFALGMLAFVCAGVNLILGSLGKKKSWLVLLVISLSLASLSLVCALFAINAWVLAEDWSALMDVVPSMSKVCAGAVMVGLGLNVMVIVQNMRKK